MAPTLLMMSKWFLLSMCWWKVEANYWAGCTNAWTLKLLISKVLAKAADSLSKEAKAVLIMNLWISCPTVSISEMA